TQREDGREHDGVKEAEQHDGCNGWHARAEQNDRQGKQRAGGKDAEQPTWSDLVHYCRTGEPSEHETKQMCLQKTSCDLFMCSRQGELTEPDDEAGNSDLCADVAKLCHHTLDQVRERQCPTEFDVRSAWGFVSGLVDFRQLREENKSTDQKENCRDDQVRRL